jgi:hypothetical protein
MKKGIIGIWLLMIVLTSCKDDINVFEKTADERTAEAIADLKEELASQEHGWRIKYRPVNESGSYYVLMTFDADDQVVIKTDLGANNGEFFEQTTTYRVDSSLGLELIMESYCFFSYLFEQEEASFGAEYEFNYLRKNEDGSLVFESKSDPIDKTILVFEPASASDHTNLLGTSLSTKLEATTEDLETFSSSYKLVYDDRNVVIYVSIDDFRRTINFKSATRKDNSGFTNVNFSTPYVIKKDSMVFDVPFVRTLLSNNISIKSIYFDDLSTSALNICVSPTTIHAIDGVTSANDEVRLETSMFDASGAQFGNVDDFFVAPIDLFFINRVSQWPQIQEDVHGALALQLYYNNDGFYALGFVIQNDNGTITYALREFTAVLTNNKITFNFAPDISIYGEQNTDANVNNINIYLDLLTEGDNTFVFQYSNEIYEFHNPCNGVSVAFQRILE